MSGVMAYWSETSILLALRSGQQRSQGLRAAAKIDIWTAGNGNRTRMASLEGWNFTIKLCPRG